MTRPLATSSTPPPLLPNDPWPHYGLVVVAFLTGRDTKGNVDAVLSRTAGNDPTAIYATLLGYLAAQRAGQADLARLRLRDATKFTASNAWLYQIVRFLNREIDEKALLAQTFDKNTTTEARCFLGLDHLIAGRTDAAREHFRWVKERGVRDNIQYIIAVAELTRLEAGAGR